jgi:RecB family exonuclease
MQVRLAAPRNCWAVTPARSQDRAFVAAALRWCRGRAPADLDRMLRSRCSGVPHDVAAAYATLAERTGSLLAAIDAQKLALPAEDRDAVLRFAERVRRIAALAERLEDEPLRDEIVQAFEVSGEPPAPTAAVECGDIAGAQPLPVLAVAPVRGRQAHFSASALNAYVECARKWFYRYACGAVEDRGSSASAYGTAFHAALEDFHGEFPRPNRGQAGAMRERIVDYVTWAFERHREGFEKAVEFDLQVRRAQRTAQRYVDWLLAESERAPFTVVGREVPANLELGGQRFVGFIDRLDRDDRTGEIGVVDYKTGSIAATAGEYREKVRTFSDFQLPFYYLARTAQGDRVTRLSLLPLKDARLDVRPVVLTVDAGVAADLERAKGRMIELSTDLASGRARSFEPTSDPSACTFCAYELACARKPPREPERFAR